MSAAANLNPNSNLLELSGVHTHIGAYHILHGVDLAVPRGQLTMLLGRNGAGKTTTLRTIMGLWRASQGRIAFGGADITALPTPAIARLNIAYVPENMGIFADLTVWPLYLPNRTRSPTFTFRAITSPLSFFLPGPTASTSPWSGFSAAFSGITMPEAVLVSFSRRFTITRSCRGRRFIPTPKSSTKLKQRLAGPAGRHSKQCGTEDC